MKIALAVVGYGKEMIFFAYFHYSVFTSCLLNVLFVHTNTLKKICLGDEMQMISKGTICFLSTPLLTMCDRTHTLNI